MAYWVQGSTDGLEILNINKNSSVLSRTVLLPVPLSTSLSFAVYRTPYNLYCINEGSVGPYQFQIDGNLGVVSGATEMLLQSHADIVHLLPALPSAISSGFFSGTRCSWQLCS